MKITNILFFLCLAPLVVINAQKSFHYDVFRGTVYDIPVKEVSKGYGDHLFDNQILNHIELMDLKIPISNEYKVKFPGVKKESLFGIVFENKLTISSEGCYQFSLESDDGSILWIDNQLIINNDFPHPMKKMMDTVNLKAQTYDLKIWYYNAFPNLYGLIFDIAKLSNEMKCVNIHSKEMQKNEVMTLHDIGFDFNSSQLKPIGQAYLDTLVSNINTKNITKIKIIGYTDDIGDKRANLKLSYKRASSVMDYLKKSLPQNIVFSAEGLGSENPKLPNTSKENRQVNRRVEVLME